jgi:hypothetical protein
MPFCVPRAERVRRGNVTLILGCRRVVRVLQLTLGIVRSLRSSLEVFRYYALRISQTITQLINMVPTIRYPNILAFSGKIFGFRSDA